MANFSFFQNYFEYIDEKYLKKIFCNKNAENDMVRVFEKLALS